MDKPSIGVGGGQPIPMGGGQPVALPVGGGQPIPMGGGQKIPVPMGGGQPIPMPVSSGQSKPPVVGGGQPIPIPVGGGKPIPMPVRGGSGPGAGPKPLPKGMFDVPLGGKQMDLNSLSPEERAAMEKLTSLQMERPLKPIEWPTKSGYLFKLGGLKRKAGMNWRKRWCVAQGTSVVYYDGRKEAKPSGFVDLRGCLVLPARSIVYSCYKPPLRYCFEVIPVTGIPLFAMSMEKQMKELQGDEDDEDEDGDAQSHSDPDNASDDGEDGGIAHFGNSADNQSGRTWSLGLDGQSKDTESTIWGGGGGCGGQVVPQVASGVAQVDAASHDLGSTDHDGTDGMSSPQQDAKPKNPLARAAQFIEREREAAVEQMKRVKDWVLQRNHDKPEEIDFDKEKDAALERRRREWQQRHGTQRHSSAQVIAVDPSVTDSEAGGDLEEEEGEFTDLVTASESTDISRRPSAIARQNQHFENERRKLDGGDDGGDDGGEDEQWTSDMDASSAVPTTTASGVSATATTTTASAEVRRRRMSKWVNGQEQGADGDGDGQGDGQSDTPTWTDRSKSKMSSVPLTTFDEFDDEDDNGGDGDDSVDRHVSSHRTKEWLLNRSKSQLPGEEGADGDGNVLSEHVVHGLAVTAGASATQTQGGGFGHAQEWVRHRSPTVVADDAAETDQGRAMVAESKTDQWMEHHPSTSKLGKASGWAKSKFGALKATMSKARLPKKLRGQRSDDSGDGAMRGGMTHQGDSHEHVDMFIPARNGGGGSKLGGSSAVDSLIDRYTLPGESVLFSGDLKDGRSQNSVAILTDFPRILVFDITKRSVRVIPVSLTTKASRESDFKISITPSSEEPAIGLEFRTKNSDNFVASIQEQVSKLENLQDECQELLRHGESIVMWSPVLVQRRSEREKYKSFCVLTNPPQDLSETSTVITDASDSNRIGRGPGKVPRLLVIAADRSRVATTLCLWDDSLKERTPQVFSASEAFEDDEAFVQDYSFPASDWIEMVYNLIEGLPHEWFMDDAVEQEETLRKMRTKHGQMSGETEKMDERIRQKRRESVRPGSIIKRPTERHRQSTLVQLPSHVDANDEVDLEDVITLSAGEKHPSAVRGRADTVFSGLFALFEDDEGEEDEMEGRGVIGVGHEVRGSNASGRGRGDTGYSGIEGLYPDDDERGEDEGVDVDVEENGHRSSSGAGRKSKGKGKSRLHELRGSNASGRGRGDTGYSGIEGLYPDDDERGEDEDEDVDVDVEENGHRSSSGAGRKSKGKGKSRLHELRGSNASGRGRGDTGYSGIEGLYPDDDERGEDANDDGGAPPVPPGAPPAGHPPSLRKPLAPLPPRPEGKAKRMFNSLKSRVFGGKGSDMKSGDAGVPARVIERGKLIAQAPAKRNNALPRNVAPTRLSVSDVAAVGKTVDANDLPPPPPSRRKGRGVLTNNPHGVPPTDSGISVTGTADTTAATPDVVDPTGVNVSVGRDSVHSNDGGSDDELPPPPPRRHPSIRESLGLSEPINPEPEKKKKSIIRKLSGMNVRKRSTRILSKLIPSKADKHHRSQFRREGGIYEDGQPVEGGISEDGQPVEGGIYEDGQPVGGGGGGNGDGWGRGAHTPLGEASPVPEARVERVDRQFTEAKLSMARGGSPRSSGDEGVVGEASMMGVGSGRLIEPDHPEWVATASKVKYRPAMSFSSFDDGDSDGGGGGGGRRHSFLESSTTALSSVVSNQRHVDEMMLLAQTHAAAAPLHMQFEQTKREEDPAARRNRIETLKRRGSMAPAPIPDGTWPLFVGCTDSVDDAQAWLVFLQQLVVAAKGGVTDEEEAAYTTMEGVGLTNTQVGTNQFTIVARDSFNRFEIVGGNQYKVTINKVKVGVKKRQSSSMRWDGEGGVGAEDGEDDDGDDDDDDEGDGEGSDTRYHCHVKDHGNGKYTVTFTLDYARPYELQVKLGDHHILGSPMVLVASAGDADASSCSMSGPGLASGVTCFPSLFHIDSRDATHNPRTQGGDTFEVKVTGAGCPTAHVEDLRTGRYQVTFTPVVAGQYFVSVTIGGKHIPESPSALTVYSDLPMSEALGTSGGGVTSHGVTTDQTHAAGNVGGTSPSDALPVLERPLLQSLPPMGADRIRPASPVSSSPPSGPGAGARGRKVTCGPVGMTMSSTLGLTPIVDAETAGLPQDLRQKSKVRLAVLVDSLFSIDRISDEFELSLKLEQLVDPFEALKQQLESQVFPTASAQHTDISQWTRGTGPAGITSMASAAQDNGMGNTTALNVVQPSTAAVSGGKPMEGFGSTVEVGGGTSHMEGMGSMGGQMIGFGSDSGLHQQQQQQQQQQQRGVVTHNTNTAHQGQQFRGRTAQQAMASRAVFFVEDDRRTPSICECEYWTRSRPSLGAVTQTIDKAIFMRLFPNLVPQEQNIIHTRRRSSGRLGGFGRAGKKVKGDQRNVAKFYPVRPSFLIPADPSSSSQEDTELTQLDPQLRRVFEYYSLYWNAVSVTLVHLHGFLQFASDCFYFDSSSRQTKRSVKASVKFYSHAFSTNASQQTEHGYLLMTMGDLKGVLRWIAARKYPQSPITESFYVLLLKDVFPHAGYANVITFEPSFVSDSVAQVFNSCRKVLHQIFVLYGSFDTDRRTGKWIYGSSQTEMSFRELVWMLRDFGFCPGFVSSSDVTKCFMETDVLCKRSLTYGEFCECLARCCCTVYMKLAKEEASKPAEEKLKAFLHFGGLTTLDRLNAMRVKKRTTGLE